MKNTFKIICESAELLKDENLGEMAKRMDGHRKPKIALLCDSRPNFAAFAPELNPLLYDADIMEYEDVQYALGADMCFFLLNATALLSQTERKLLSEVIFPCFGANRTVIVLRNLEQIPPDEIGEIYSYMNVFLGGVRPAVVSLQDLGTYIRRELPLKTAEVLQNNERELVDYTIAALKRCKETLETTVIANEAELDRKKQSAKNEIDELQNQLRREKLRFAALIGAEKTMTISAAREYGEKTRSMVKNELSSVTDVTRAQKYISGYLEYLWQHFLDSANTTMRERVIEFFGKSEIAEADTKSGLVYIKNKGMGGELFSGVTGVTNFLTIASGLLLFVNLPVALGTFAASRIVKTAFKKDADAEKLSAFIGSVLDGCQKLEGLMVEKISAAFVDFERAAMEKLSSAYNEAENQIVSDLDFVIESSLNTEYREKLAALIDNLSEVC